MATKTKTKTKKPEAPAKGPTKLSVAQRIAQLTPEMFEDGNTPEALAKRSTVAELEKMLREAETLFEAREKAALNRSMSTPDPEPKLGPIGEGSPTLGENTQDPTWPSSIVKCCVVVSTQEIQPATGLPHLVDVDPKTGDDIAPPPALDVAGDPLMAALGVTPETVDSFADLIDPAYEKRLDEAANAENVRRRAQEASNASNVKEPQKPKRPLPPVGTKLTHTLSNGAAERAGTTTQTAEVVADGILFEGRTYPSLTAAGSAASVRAGLNSNVNGWVYWGLEPKAPKTSATDATIKAERDALLASLEGLAPVIIAILTTPADTPIGMTNINKMLQAWTQKHDTVWRPFAGSAVASTPTVTPPPA